jgi:hypothetical protein
MEDYILREMEERGADGVDFVPIWLDDSMPPIYKSYTKQEWIDSDGSYPKTNRKYWKMINGKKEYIDDNVRFYVKQMKEYDITKLDIEELLKDVKKTMEEIKK